MLGRPVLLGTCLGGAMLMAPACASAAVRASFVDAVPGSVRVELVMSQGERARTLGIAHFGQRTPTATLPTGRSNWWLRNPTTGDTIGRGTIPLQDGTNTLVALERGDGVTLAAYRDADVGASSAGLRVVHAAPELGAPDLMVDERARALRLAYASADVSMRVVSGVHRIRVVKPGTESALVATRVRLRPGQTTTVVVVGTRGRTLRMVPVSEQVTAKPDRVVVSPSSGVGGDAGSGLEVAKGASLWDIARDRLGEDASSSAVNREIQRLYRLNRNIMRDGPDVLATGQKLRVR